MELQCSDLYCNYVLQGYHMTIVNSCSPRKKTSAVVPTAILRQVTRYNKVSSREFDAAFVTYCENFLVWLVMSR